MQKRFIAGAVCPRCGVMDRLVTYQQGNDIFRECVSCGFEEKQLAQVEVKELDTRVNQADPSTESVESEVTPVRIIHPDKSDGRH